MFFLSSLSCTLICCINEFFYQLRNIEVVFHLGQKLRWHPFGAKIGVLFHLGQKLRLSSIWGDIWVWLPFGKEYESLDDMQKHKMKKRAGALLRKKYLETWNKKMTRISLQQGTYLMIWSTIDVANDFTRLKDQEGEQAYPAAFLQFGIEHWTVPAVSEESVGSRI